MVMGQRQGDKGLKPHNELQMICPKAHFIVAFQNTLNWSFQCVSNIAEFFCIFKIHSSLIRIIPIAHKNSKNTKVVRALVCYKWLTCNSSNVNGLSNGSMGKKQCVICDGLG